MGVGNLSRALYLPYNANQAIPGATTLNTRRPLYSINPNLSDVNLATSQGRANYYALQVTLDKRISHGVNFLLGYAWAHPIDNVPLEFGGGAAGATPQDPRFLSAERSNSIIDRRQRLTLSYLWMLPFGKGREFMNGGGPLDWVLGGWQTNGIFFTQTGLYFSPRYWRCQPQTPAPVAGRISLEMCATPKTLTNWFSASAFSTPAQYTYGSAGRNSLIGPGRTNVRYVGVGDIPGSRTDVVPVPL